MKTAKEVLDEVGKGFGLVSEPFILKAMEEYANQFKVGVSFEINFDGHVKVQLEIRGGELSIIQSMNGHGNKIENKDIIITKL